MYTSIFALFLSILISVVHPLAGQPFAKWTNSELVLNNGLVQRTIKLPATEGSFSTTLYKPVAGDFKYFQKIKS